MNADFHVLIVGVKYMYVAWLHRTKILQNLSFSHRTSSNGFFNSELSSQYLVWLMIEYYSEATWASWHLKSPETRLFIQQLDQPSIK